MRRLLGLLTSFLILTLIGSYAWTHRHHLVTVVAAPAKGGGDPAAIPTYAEVQEAQKSVTVAGPLADYMAQRQPAAVEQTAQIETLQPISRKESSGNATSQPTTADHVGDSPVGTSNSILHQMFKVAGTVRVLFEVPAHAANPQLRGTYESFVRHGRALSSDDAELEFLVLNDEQYGEFVKGHGSEAVFSADKAHDQEVNASLPPTFDHPAKYYLIFRNDSHAAARVVQADFRIGF